MRVPLRGTAPMADSPEDKPDDGYRTYGIEYEYAGKKWAMHIVALSELDAMARLHRAATWGSVIGELKATIPAVPGAGLLTQIICWWRNLWTA